MSDALKQSLKDQEDRKREMMRLALLDEFNKGMKEGLSQNKIDSNLSSLKRILENQYGIPFSMATGGSVQGIGSLSNTARDMFRGPRGIGAYQQFAEGGAATARDKVEIESLRNAVMMTESGGDPNAVSPDGAIGLMQIMLPTAREPGFGVENAFEIADRLGYVFNDTSDETLKRLLFLPDVNVEFGNQYLDAMLNQYSEVDDALRAYNAGKTNVDRFIASGRNLNVLTDEAVQYPIKVTAAMQGFNPKDMNQMEMFRQAPETAVALMEDYPAPPVENRMFSPPPVRPDLPPTFFPSVMPQQRVAEGIETIQPAVPGVIRGQPKKMYQEPEGIATLTSSVRPRPRPLRFEDGGAATSSDFLNALMEQSAQAEAKREEENKAIALAEQRQKFADEEEVMSQPLDNSLASTYARAAKMGEDEFMVGVAPTNINPMYQLAMKGDPQGIFGVLPPREETTTFNIPKLGSIELSGYDDRSLKHVAAGIKKPFIAQAVPDFKDRKKLRSMLSFFAEDLTDEEKQQLLRPVLADPMMANKEVLAHEAGHLYDDEFFVKNMDVVYPLYEELLDGYGMEYGDGFVGEYLQELFEPVEFSEKFTEMGVTDEMRQAAQDYLRRGVLDTDVLSPATIGVLSRLKKLMNEDSKLTTALRPRPRPSQLN